MASANPVFLVNALKVEGHLAQFLSAGEIFWPTELTCLYCLDKGFGAAIELRHLPAAKLLSSGENRSERNRLSLDENIPR